MWWDIRRGINITVIRPSGTVVATTRQLLPPTFAELQPSTPMDVSNQLSCEVLVEKRADGRCRICSLIVEALVGQLTSRRVVVSGGS